MAKLVAAPCFWRARSSGFCEASVITAPVTDLPGSLASGRVRNVPLPTRMTDEHSNRIGKAAPYLGRLLSDDYVQDQVRELVTDLREGTRRAKRKGAKNAVSDSASVGSSPLPLSPPAERHGPFVNLPPKRHPIRRALAVAAVAGAAAAIYRQRQSSSATSQQ